MSYELMPSEIARLVYGYLVDAGCEKSSKAFLEESPLLKEFAQGLSRGVNYQTKINGKSLDDYISTGSNTIGESSMITESTTTQTEIPFDATVRQSLSNILAGPDFNNSLSDKLEKIINEKLERPSAISTPIRSRHFNSNNSIHASPRRKTQTPQRLKISNTSNQPNRSNNFIGMNASTSVAEGNALNVNSSPATFMEESFSSIIDINPEKLYESAYQCVTKIPSFPEELAATITDYWQQIPDSELPMEQSPHQQGQQQQVGQSPPQQSQPLQTQQSQQLQTQQSQQLQTQQSQQLQTQQSQQLQTQQSQHHIQQSPQQHQQQLQQQTQQQQQQSQQQTQQSQQQQHQQQSQQQPQQSPQQTQQQQSQQQSQQPQHQQQQPQSVTSHDMNQVDTASASTEHRVVSLFNDLSNFCGDICDDFARGKMYNDIMDDVVSQEINSTPFKLFDPPPSTGTASSEASLNTPQVAFTSPSIQSQSRKQSVTSMESTSVVKNFSTEFKTPKKYHLITYGAENEEQVQEVSSDKIPAVNNSAILKAVDKATKQPRKAASKGKGKAVQAPIFENQHLYKSTKNFGRLKSNQNQVQTAIMATKTKRLTTTIERVVDQEEDDDEEEEEDKQSKKDKQTPTVSGASSAPATTPIASEAVVTTSATSSVASNIVASNNVAVASNDQFNQSSITLASSVNGATNDQLGLSNIILSNNVNGVTIDQQPLTYYLIQNGNTFLLNTTPILPTLQSSNITYVNTVPVVNSEQQPQQQQPQQLALTDLQLPEQQPSSTPQQNQKVVNTSIDVTSNAAIMQVAQKTTMPNISTATLAKKSSMPILMPKPSTSSNSTIASNDESQQNRLKEKNNTKDSGSKSDGHPRKDRDHKSKESERKGNPKDLDKGKKRKWKTASDDDEDWFESQRRKSNERKKKSVQTLLSSNFDAVLDKIHTKKKS